MKPANRMPAAKGTATDAGRPTPPSNPMPPPAALEQADVGHFFRAEDWWAAGAAFALALAAFYHFMAPEVTLQDSGELVTGAFTFGVPHPPGYPLWAFVAFLWSHLVVPFGNPAWRIGTLSVVTGALVVGVMTIMMTRSIRVLLSSLPWADSIDRRLQHWMAITIGMSTALLFGFNRGVWLWACVSEMRVLNVFSFVLMACTFFAWMIQSARRGFLYATILIFGLSMTNHQTVTVMAGALVMGTLAEGIDRFFRRRALLPVKGGPGTFSQLMTALSTFWELAVAVLFSAAAGFLLFAWLRASAVLSVTEQPDFLKTVALLLAGGVALAVGMLYGWVKLRQAMLYTALFLAGCAFYLYMPLAAGTNPPMNWGYAATREGFLHSITRGQYERLQMADLFSAVFFTKIKVFILALVQQYSWPLCLLGLLTIVVAAVWVAIHLKRRRWLLVVWALSFAALLIGLSVLRALNADPAVADSGWLVLFWAFSMATLLCLLIGIWLYLRWPGGSWLIFVWTAFFVTSFGLLTIINPQLDRQEQEITIKFFAPAHGFFAMLIGYGIVVVLSLVARLRGAAAGIAVRVACLALLALPVVTYRNNWKLCNLKDYDYGYYFGYWMFNPGGGYPPMERDSVLYGGTDPGRFVPTYMIFCESRVPAKDRYFDKSFDRSDVYIITQNALADNTYMNYIRDQYDFSRPPNTDRLQRWLGRDHVYPREPIHIPSPDDGNNAFRTYMDEVQAGRIPPSADIKVENGHVTVQGVGGVMAINGILARWIFDQNKEKHAFYVEESYVINWMYPYLRPSGIIMKIEKEPLPSPQVNPGLWTNIVAQDRAYWDKLSAGFLKREDFRRNNDAKKSFSKLRAAIAGLYLYRGLWKEAEYAFGQSMDLCPESPEASFRLIDMLVQQHRYTEAKGLARNYAELDEYNDNAKNQVNAIAEMERCDTRRRELEPLVQKGQVDVNLALELAALYQRLNMGGPFEGLMQSFLASTNLPPNILMAVAQLSGNGRRWPLAERALRRYLAAAPRDFKAQIELACAQGAQGQAAEAMASLREAVSLGGEPARAILRADQRLAPLRANPDFVRLAQPSRPAMDAGMLPFGQ